jgi:hypothetical protein
MKFFFSDTLSNELHLQRMQRSLIALSADELSSKPTRARCYAETGLEPEISLSLDGSAYRAETLRRSILAGPIYGINPRYITTDGL